MRCSSFARTVGRSNIVGPGAAGGCRSRWVYPLGELHPSRLPSRFMHAYVDETKARGLVVVAAVADPRDLTDVRKALGDLRLKGQERIHFKSERDSRRKEICSVMVALPVHVHVYDAAALPERAGRTMALQMLVADLAALSATRLIIEQDDSLVKADRQTLYSAIRRHRIQDRLSYEHVRAKQEPMLWIPGAVAWCLAKGGHWGSRVEPIIHARNTVR